jgi:hypothetical protein
MSRKGVFVKDLELEEVFERHTRVINEMMERGGVRNQGDVLRVEGFVEELEKYKGKGSFMQRHFVRQGIKILKETAQLGKEYIGGVDIV